MSNSGCLPVRIVAGETIWIAAANANQGAADLFFTGYTPAAGYTLAYQFAADTPITVSAAANGAGTGWTLEVTGAQTLLWQPGRIVYTGLATLSGRSFAVDTGSITVDASPLRVSSWVAVLASVDAAIAQYASNPQGSISCGEISVSFRSLEQLTALRDYVAYRLQQDSAARVPRIIRSRFVMS